jgi:TctA family transporter
MLDVALTALGIITEPTRLVFLFSGVLIGLGLGVIPGGRVIPIDGYSCAN